MITKGKDFFAKSIGDRDIIVYLEPNFDFIKDLELYTKNSKIYSSKTKW